MRPTDEIEQVKKELVEKIKSYCRDQVVLWRQVPDLAKEANRLKGYACGRYNLANCGLWAVLASDLDGLCVNLKTGELTPEIMIDNITLGCLKHIVHALDAKKVINLLMNEIKPAPHVLS